MQEVSGRNKALEERKSRIIEAAISCFLENGYNQTGIREIARRAGISLGNLYNHFRSKDAVLAEIAVLEREELKPFQQLLADGSDPATTLMRFTDKYATYTATGEYVVLSIEIAGEAVHNPQIASLFIANRGILVTALSGLLERGQSSGDFRAFSDCGRTAELILDTIEGYALYAYLNRHKTGSPNTASLEEFIHHATSK